MLEKHYNYTEELAIDPSALDVEWLKQSQLFMKYAEASAKARKDLDVAKEKLDLARAEVDADIRSNFEVYTGSDKKPTETHITSIITAHPDYKSALSVVNEAKYVTDIMSLAVKAFDQRKVALENLVRLLGQSYFSGPQEPRDLGLEFNKSASQSVVRGKVYHKLNEKSKS